MWIIKWGDRCDIDLRFRNLQKLLFLELLQMFLVVDKPYIKTIATGFCGLPWAAKLRIFNQNQINIDI
jgi:hypothetical protein